MLLRLIVCCLLSAAVCSCGHSLRKRLAGGSMSSSGVCCVVAVSTAYRQQANEHHLSSRRDNSKSGMVWIPAGNFAMGSQSRDALPDEQPVHEIDVKGFWMDSTEVTNEQFRRFVIATGYVTTAERPLNREIAEMAFPEEDRPIADSFLEAGSIVFSPPGYPVPLTDYAQWWVWEKGADWKHPQGKNSDLRGKEHFPVVHISWQDAMAYCRWAGKRLPTEAEWEWAAHGGLPSGKIYPWGDEPINSGRPKANTWQGMFPNENTLEDGFYGPSPAGSFPANGYGLYDMAGNVWEWCADNYQESYQIPANTAQDESSGTNEPGALKASTNRFRAIRGGSFLCNDIYCSGFRVSRRMKAEEDSSMEHLGFRCVAD